MKKKVLIVSGGVLPVPAAMGGAVETLIDSIIEENSKAGNLEIDVVSCGKKNSYEKIDGRAAYLSIGYPWLVRIKDRLLYFYSGKIKKDWRSMFLRNKYKSIYYRGKVKEKVDFSKYDAVIVENNMSLLDMIRMEMGDQFSEKCFYHMHSVLVDNKAMIPYLASCKKILTVSDYVTEELKKTVPEFQNSVIEKVTNGIEPFEQSEESYRNAGKELREKYNIPENACVFLYSGRLSIEKGPMELLKAFARANLENSVLLFVGSALSGSGEITPYTADMKACAEQTNQKVIFTGYVKHDQVQSFYHMADVLVIPSVVGDAAPLTLLEGMACGIPIISAKIGGIPEYAKGYREIYWAEPGDGFAEKLEKQLELFAEKNKRTDLEKRTTDTRRQNRICFDTKSFYDSFCRAITE